jgi:hypothetical protein
VNHKEPIDWVFEAGTAGSGQIGRLMHLIYTDTAMRKDFRVNSWSFGGKDIRPFQAADVIAYEVFKQVTNQLVQQPQKRNIRISFQHLTRSQDDDYLEYWTKEQLEEYVSTPTVQTFIQHLMDRERREG